MFLFGTVGFLLINIGSAPAKKYFRGLLGYGEMNTILKHPACGLSTSASLPCDYNSNFD